MNISHYPCVGNSSRLFATPGTNQSKHLTPDYFLPASQSENYYSKKYGGNHSTESISSHYVTNITTGIKPIYQSKSSKISRVASIMLLSLGFLATSVKVDASPSLDFEPVASTTSYTAQYSQQEPKKKPILTRAAHKVAKRLGFSGVGAATREPEISSMEELKKLYAAEYGKSMDATISRSEDKSLGLAEALKKLLALREKTLERRKAEDIFTSEDIEDICSKPVDAISIASSSSTEYEEPWQAPDVMIGEAFTSEFTDIKQIEPSAPPLEFSLPKQVEPSAPPLSASNSIEDLQSKDLNLLSNEESKAIELIDQAVEDSSYSSPSISSSPTNEVGFQGGYETNISNCSFDNTSSTEYDTAAEIRAYKNVEVESQNKKLKTRKARNARAAEARYSSRDIEQGLGELHRDTDFSDGSSDEDSISGTDGYDTVYTSSSSSEHSYDNDSEWEEDFSGNSDDEDDTPLPPPPSEEELADLEKISEVSNPDQTLGTPTDVKSSEMQKESTAASVLEIQDKVEEEDNLPQEISTNLDSIASTEPQEQATSMSQEELRKKATMVAASHNQARNMSKIASHQIKHRIFARDMVTAAVASGDEEAGEALDDAAEKTHGYSIWSSGTLGSNKQKSKAGLNGYSTKIAGGTIGLELNLENDLLVGSSFSKFRSNIKQQRQEACSDALSRDASIATRYDTHIFSLYGSSPVSRNMSISLIGSAGYSKGKKAHAKLFSLEPHLNYKLKLPRAVTLIPHIGLRYEYEKASRHKEQIASNLSIERSKKSYQALNSEIGSRVIFAPIKLNGSTPRATSITPTAHFSVERRIGGSGKSHPFTLTYHEFGETIGTGVVSSNAQNERTSLNAGIGLIASRKNIKLELLYDQQRQKRFKSHQGVLKLKVSL